MTILSHPPITAADLEQTQENFPSAVFLIDALGLTNSASATTFADKLGVLTFAASSIADGGSGGKKVLALDQNITGTLPPPGTTDIIAFRIGEWGTNLGEIGNIGATGGISLGLTGSLHDGTNTSTTTTNFAAGATLRLRALAVDWSANLMTPYELIPDTTNVITAKTATDLSLLTVNNASGGIPNIAQTWNEPSQFPALYCMGLLYFENGLPPTASIMAGLDYIFRRVVDDGVIELPPFWSKR